MKVLFSLTVLVLLGIGLGSRPASLRTPEFASTATTPVSPTDDRDAARPPIDSPSQSIASRRADSGRSNARASDGAPEAIDPLEREPLSPPRWEPDVSYQSWPLDERVLAALKAGYDQDLPTPAGDWIRFRLRERPTLPQRDSTPDDERSLATYFLAAEEPGVLTERSGRWFGTFSHRGAVYFFENQGTGTVIARADDLERRWIPGLNDARIPTAGFEPTSP